MEEGGGEDVGRAPPRIPRRRFLRFGILGGAAAAATALGAGYLSGFLRPRGTGRPPWEVAPGVVDYDRVPVPGPGSATLRIAQWFDYWPGVFLDRFRARMRDEHGIDVHLEIEYFTSNEELFLWMAPFADKTFDIVFPSQYHVRLMDRPGWLYNLNREWLPNLRHVDPRLIGQPADDPYDQRGGTEQVSIPYFWGTTGIGYRTDVFDEADMVDFGWDVFLQPTYKETTTRKRMTMLREMTDVIPVGFKQAGWEWQRSQGFTPTGDIPPYGDQWLATEVDEGKVQAAREWLLRAKENLFSFNSTGVITSLQTAVTYVCHAWSGDAVLANAPDATNPFPVGYVIPKQGAVWWIDTMAITSECRNLWIAHKFLDYIHEPAVMKDLALWNRYACTNLAARDLLEPLGPNQWDLANDPWLYPDDATWRRLDFGTDVGLDALNRLYVPLWDELAFS